MEELAARAGLSARTIYNAEVRGIRPHRATRRVIAEALGCEPDELFPLNEQSPAGERAGSVETISGVKVAGYVSRSG